MFFNNQIQIPAIAGLKVFNESVIITFDWTFFLKIPCDSLSVPMIYFKMKEVKSNIGCGAICASHRDKCSAFFFQKDKAICQLANVENGTIKNNSLVDFTYISLGKFKLI